MGRAGAQSSGLSAQFPVNIKWSLKIKSINKNKPHAYSHTYSPAYGDELKRHPGFHDVKILHSTKSTIQIINK